MRFSPTVAIVLALFCLTLPACRKHEEAHHEAAHKVIATNPESKSVTLTEQYVCQIHSRRHIQVQVLETGYLEEIKVKEGQSVKAGDVMFTVRPILYESKLAAENAEAELAKLQYQYAQKLSAEKVISENEVKLRGAELDKANAEAKLAKAELDFATVIAPFDGIIDRLQQQQGSLVQEGEVLTTLSDNDLMWVYFNVPEARYLEYMADLKQHKGDMKIELVLANGETFGQPGVIGAIEADFNNETGNIPFRADFPNPEHLLRHGQTGTIMIHRAQDDSLVIPQRAVFENLAKRYVYVVDKDNVAHQREIVVKNELEDLFVIDKGGIDVNDKIVFEGVRQVRDGEKVECELRRPEEVVAQLKFRAE